jgi:hypothetical protein
MLPFSLIAASRYSYKAGTGAATITAPAGSQVLSISVRAPSGTDATFTITPGGANQTGTVGETITVLAGTSFSRDFIGQLGAGTVITITGSGSYFVDYFS